MSVKKYTETIINELNNANRFDNEKELNDFVSLVRNSKHIFLAGAGRSGVAIRGFANRLLHLGFSVSLIGEISSPHTHSGDVLIIGSGSGETESLVSLAKKAKKAGVKIGLITMDKNSSIGKLADVVVVLPGVSPKLASETSFEISSIQPMGSLFEQISFLTYDGVILELMEQMNETTETMFPRHADLE